MTIFLTALLAVVMWQGGSGGIDPVELPVMFDAPYVLHTEIAKSSRRDTQSPVTETGSWEVEVSPTDSGFLTVWHDLSKRQSLAMEIETSDTLTPTRVVNLAEVRRSIAEAMHADDKGGPDAQAMVLFGNLPEQTLTALLTQDATLIALGQGRRLTPGTPYRYSTNSRPFEGGPLLANESAYELESLDEEAGRAVVVWTTHIDEKALAAVLPDLMRAAMGAFGLDPNDQEKVAEAVAGAVMTKSSRCRYQIVIETGLAETVNCVTLLEVQMLGQRSKTETRLEATQTLLR